MQAIPKSSLASGLPPTLPPGSWMPLPPHPRRRENLSLLQLFTGKTHLFLNQWLHHHLSLCHLLCLCFLLFIIWQRRCPSMHHEQGFSMDAWAGRLPWQLSGGRSKPRLNSMLNSLSPYCLSSWNLHKPKSAFSVSITYVRELGDAFSYPVYQLVASFLRCCRTAMSFVLTWAVMCQLAYCQTARQWCQVHR